MSAPELTLEEMQRLVRDSGGFEQALATFPDADVRLLFEMYCRHEGLELGAAETEDDFEWLMLRIEALRKVQKQ
jgi:hypothetical protein